MKTIDIVKKEINPMSKISELFSIKSAAGRKHRCGQADQSWRARGRAR
jgi:hypothetical protein